MKFRNFWSPPCGQFSENFRHIGGDLHGIVPTSKFCFVGVALFGARALQKTPGGKGPRFDSRRGASGQHILLDTEDDGHEEDHKDDEEDEDEFEDDKG